jgi:hypothetical protein
MTIPHSSGDDKTGNPECGGRPHWSTTHGMHRTPEYRAWQKMRQRCSNPKCQRYDRYGARGIRVCERWRSFEAFFEDMGHRPSPRHSLDRIDNDGNYEPGNCRWATRAEQNRNRGDNRLVTFGGLTMTVAEWARTVGVHVRTLYCRLANGWSIEDSLTKPVERRAWPPHFRVSDNLATAPLSRDSVKAQLGYASAAAHTRERCRKRKASRCSGQEIQERVDREQRERGRR